MPFGGRRGEKPLVQSGETALRGAVLAIGIGYAGQAGARRRLGKSLLRLGQLALDCLLAGFERLDRFVQPLPVDLAPRDLLVEPPLGLPLDVHLLGGGGGGACVVIPLRQPGPHRHVRHVAGQLVQQADDLLALLLAARQRRNEPVDLLLRGDRLLPEEARGLLRLRAIPVGRRAGRRAMRKDVRGSGPGGGRVSIGHMLGELRDGMHRLPEFGHRRRSHVVGQIVSGTAASADVLIHISDLCLLLLTACR